MQVQEIPRILFEELPEKWGCRNERDVTFRNGEYKVVDLSSRGRGVASVGYREEDGSAALLVWPYSPNSKDSRMPQPLLEIRCYPRKTGTWAAGKGYEMRDAATATVMDGIWLDNLPKIRLLATILTRATELATSPECAKVTYWSLDRTPRYSKDEVLGR